MKACVKKERQETKWQLKHDQNLHQNMIKICTKYYQNMIKICSRHKWKRASKKKGEQQNLDQNQLLRLDNWGACKLIFGYYLKDQNYVIFTNFKFLSFRKMTKNNEWQIRHFLPPQMAGLVFMVINSIPSPVRLILNRDKCFIFDTRIEF